MKNFTNDTLESNPNAPQLEGIPQLGRNRIRIPNKPKELKRNKSIKEPKFARTKRKLELVSISEKFSLCLQYIFMNIVTRQFNGNIINRMKGRISSDEFKENMIILGKANFNAVFSDLLISKQIEINAGLINEDTINEITELLAGIPLKPKNPNQKSKLKNKIITQLASHGIHLNNSDPLISIRRKLMELAPNDRAKVLVSIPSS